MSIVYDVDRIRDGRASPPGGRGDPARRAIFNLAASFQIVEDSPNQMPMPTVPGPVAPTGAALRPYRAPGARPRAVARPERPTTRGRSTIPLARPVAAGRSKTSGSNRTAASTVFRHPRVRRRRVRPHAARHGDVPARISYQEQQYMTPARPRCGSIAVQATTGSPTRPADGVTRGLAQTRSLSTARSQSP